MPIKNFDCTLGQCPSGQNVEEIRREEQLKVILRTHALKYFIQ